ncbi:unnamed protein product [Cylicocyclus nassatus]|uniref:Uncharacterized protein n=1 Tax=Cylicocyclus nassatus TaxID=53992 RepID=A0AA36GPI2_CYLNA|nr:unnamed protein product [Cylicocyclus nassatus]
MKVSSEVALDGSSFALVTCQVKRFQMGSNSATILVYSIIYMSVEFVLSEEIDCANYDLPNHDVDQYGLFAKRCSGSKKLGFRKIFVFYARFLSEANFNKLFENVEESRFEMHIEDTDLADIKMPRLIRAQRPHDKRLFVIRANAHLKSVEIPLSAFDVQESFHVEIDGNPELADDVLDRFQKNCEKGMGKKCDIFKASRRFNFVIIEALVDTYIGARSKHCRI